MANNFVFIPNGDTQYYPYWRLQLVVEIFGHSTSSANQSKFNKSPKRCYIRKCYYKTLGTSVINRPLSTPFLSAVPSQRERENNGFFITQCPKFYNNIFLFVWLTSLETLVNFDWLIHLVECSNVSTINFDLQR